MQINKAPNTTIQINGKEHLYFSGTSYLGVSNLQEFQEILFKNIKKWGTSFGSSRNSNIQLDVYEKGEKYLSDYLNTEDSVVVSSGTVAGLLTLTVLRKITDVFFHMPKTHPAILPKKSFPVFNENGINPLFLNDDSNAICIVVDAIPTLETSPFNFDFLNKIPEHKKVYIVIDESHSLGVLGDNGNGISSIIKLPNTVEKICISSFSKAFSVNGGVVSGRKNFIKKIRKESLFVGSAAMNPAFLESVIYSKALYAKQLQKLQVNCNYVFNKIKGLEKVRMSNNYPVFFFDDEGISEYLLSKKVVITSFYYPTASKKINRIVLNANHNKNQLDYLIDCLFSY